MSDVERYLAELSRRLAGTGATGRRALEEVREHLHSAVAEELAAGRSRQQGSSGRSSASGRPRRSSARCAAPTGAPC